LATIVAGCASPTPDNPYPGNGGSMFHSPTERDLADAHLSLDSNKLDTFRAGVTMKQNIVAALGQPTWWASNDDGYSSLGYDFLAAGSTVNIPEISPATFVFDAHNVLVDADYPDSYKTWHVDRGPYSYAYVKVLAGLGPREMFLGGIIPADWARDSPPGMETIPIGGYIRSKIHVEKVLAGNITRRNLVVRFTVAGAFLTPYTAYMLLSTDKFGTTRVINWDREPSLCKLDEANMDGEELVALLRELKSSPGCAKAQ